MSRPLLEWSDDFLIGIRELDYEHRKLIEDINELHRELVEHDTAEHVEDTLGQIHARMQAHFALEEHYMQSHDYDRYVEHKGEHIRLLDDYTDFLENFSADPDGVGYSAAIEDHLKHWIVDHILTSDKAMAVMKG